MSAKANITYDPSVVLPSQIVQQINSLGYSAALIETPPDGQNKIDLVVKICLAEVKGVIRVGSWGCDPLSTGARQTSEVPLPPYFGRTVAS
jgi:hypothetical protein